ncbi:hypothetical protein [Flavobacterium sp.]|uniref:hypothetical protein n=1 Tax=Flavobacterium sp. TaxID=239 RepID=UPI0039E6E6F9
MKNWLTFLCLIAFFCGQAQNKKQVYKRFSGTITVVDEDVIKYDDELLLIYKTDKYLKMVFESGLLYPGMFKYPGILYQKKDALNAVVHNFTVESCQWINSKSGKSRLFKLMLKPKKDSQSTAYYIEIYNAKGTARSDFSNFVQGAELKSIRRG